MEENNGNFGPEKDRGAGISGDGNAGLAALKVNYGERRQRNRQRIGPAVNRLLTGLDAAGVSQAAAIIIARVAVEDLSPPAAARRADAVVQPRHRREVARDEDNIVRRLAFAHETQRAPLRVVAVDPLEARSEERRVGKECRS